MPNEEVKFKQSIVYAKMSLKHFHIYVMLQPQLTIYFMQHYFGVINNHPLHTHKLSMVKHGGSITRQGCFSAAWTGIYVKPDVDGAK